MGHIKNLLSSRKVDNNSGYKHFVMEAAENIHLHWRDTRIQMLPDNFKDFNDYVKNAYDKWILLGKPIQDDKNINLGSPFKCKDPGFFCNKFTIEEQETDTIHLHWRDTRIHSDVGHFLYFSEMVRESVIAFKLAHKETIKFSNIQCPATSDIYSEWLDEYIATEAKINPDDLAELLYLKHRTLTNNIDIDTSLDKKLLYAIYESIKRYGYAKGPYFGNYIECWRIDGNIYMAAAHRWSVLNKLGYEYIDVCITDPPNPIQVVE